jgi:hypothetical protein
VGDGEHRRIRGGNDPRTVLSDTDVQPCRWATAADRRVIEASYGHGLRNARPFDQPDRLGIGASAR